MQKSDYQALKANLLREDPAAWRTAKGIKSLADSCGVAEEELPGILVEMLKQGELNESWQEAFRSVFAETFSTEQLQTIAKRPEYRELLDALGME